MYSPISSRANWYRNKAADFYRMAKEAHDLPTQEQYREPALQWLDLIKLAEVNEGVLIEQEPQALSCQ